MFKTENLALMFWQSYFKKILNIFSSLKSALIIFWMDYWHKTIKDTKQCQKGNNRQNTIAATFNHNLSLIVLFAITEQTMKTARIRGEIIVTLRPDNATTPLLTGNLLKKKKKLLLKTKTIKKTKKKTDMYCNELETPLYVIPKIRQKWISLVKLLIILIV